MFCAQEKKNSSVRQITKIEIFGVPSELKYYVVTYIDRRHIIVDHGRKFLEKFTLVSGLKIINETKVG